VSTATATAEGIRAALAGFAAVSEGNVYPLAIGDYTDLKNLANLHGGALPDDEKQVFIKSIGYASSSEGRDNYTLTITVDVPTGEKLEVTPQGVKKIVSTP
jgi:hypothetical protein